MGQEKLDGNRRAGRDGPDPFSTITNPQRAMMTRVMIATARRILALRRRSHRCRRGYNVFPIKSVSDIKRACLEKAAMTSNGLI